VRSQFDGSEESLPPRQTGQGARFDTDAVFRRVVVANGSHGGQPVNADQLRKQPPTLSASRRPAASLQRYYAAAGPIAEASSP